MSVWSNKEERTKRYFSEKYFYRFLNWLIDLFRIPGLKQKLLPFLVSSFWMICCGYWNAVVQVLIQNYIIRQNVKISPPLFDIGFQQLPEVENVQYADYFLFAIVILSVTKTFFTQKLDGLACCMKRLNLIHGFIFLLRSISIVVTILPNPEIKCKPEESTQIFSYAISVFFGVKRTCYDVLFSGHAVAITLYSLLWYQYTENIFIKILIEPLAIIAYCVLIATRFHYTVDVLYGAVIAFCCWTVYHYLLRDIREKLDWKSNVDQKPPKIFGNVGYFNNNSLPVRMLVAFIIWNEGWKIPKEKTTNNETLDKLNIV